MEIILWRIVSLLGKTVCFFDNIQRGLKRLITHLKDTLIRLVALHSSCFKYMETERYKNIFEQERNVNVTMK